MSWVRTRVRPPTSSTAASSSSPRAAGWAARARRESMKADSVIRPPCREAMGRGTMRSMVEGRSFAVRPSTGLQPVPLPTGYARREDKSPPDVLRHRVEDAVDEAGLLLAVKGLRDVDIFGDDAAGGDVDAGGELVGAGAKDLAHRPVEAVERPVGGQAGGDEAVQLV